MNSAKNIYSSEASIKYFLTQALASLIMVFRIIILLFNNEFIAPSINYFLLTIINSALLTKLGAAPFHFWFPEVMEGLSWINSLLLITWQKIAPMILIINNRYNWVLISTIALLSVIIGGTIRLNQVRLRKIIAFSSINHIGWILAAIIVSFSIWTWYFIIYSAITLNVVVIFVYTQRFYLKQLTNTLNINKIIKLSILINFISIGGLPPFLGFLPKWLLINSLLDKQYVLLPICLVIITLISLYIYLRIIFSSLIISTIETKINPKSQINFIFKSINLLSLIIIPTSTILFNLT